MSSRSTQFRRWVRLSVATITSTALVGGAVIAAPSHPLLPSAQVAAAQTQSQEVATASGNVASVQLGSNEVVGIAGAGTSWSADSGEVTTREDFRLTLELLEALNLEVGTVGAPLLKTPATPDGLLDLGGGLGVLGAYAEAGNGYAEAGAGVLNGDGSIDLDDNAAGGSVATTLDVTRLFEQLGVSALTDLIVDEVSLELGAASSVARQTVAADGVPDNTSEISAATVGLNLSIPLLGSIFSELEKVTKLLDGTLGEVLGIQVGNLLAPLHSGATPESSLVYINLQEGILKVNLDQLYPDGLSQAPENTSLLSGDNIAQILGAVSGLLTSEGGLAGNLQNLKGEAEDAQEEGNKGLLDNLLNLVGETLGAVLGLVGQLLGALNPLLGSNGLLEQVVQGLSPVFEALEQVLKITVNKQETAPDGTFSVTALEVTVLGEDTNQPLISIPLGKSTVKATYDPTYDGGDGDEPGDKDEETPGGDDDDDNGDEPGDEAGDEPGDDEGDDNGDEPGDEAGDEPGDDEGDDNGDGPGDEPGDDEDDDNGDEPGDEPGDDGSAGGSAGGSSIIGGGGDGDGSSEALMQCVASPTTGLAALLAVLGTTAAVGGPVVEPLTRVVSEQISATLRQVTGASSVGPQPEWLTQINRGLEEAASAVDSQVIASALFGAGVLAILFSPEFCGEEKEGLSSQLSS